MQKFPNPLPADQMLDLFKQMVGVVSHLHENGYVHTELSSKSFRFFPTSLENASFYTPNSGGRVKLSGLQRAVAFSQSDKCFIRSASHEYSIPAKLRPGRSQNAVQERQDEAVSVFTACQKASVYEGLMFMQVWSLCVVLAEMETGIHSETQCFAVHCKNLDDFDCIRSFS